MGLKTRSAYELFASGKYKEALALFKELNRDIGGSVFSLNINKCLERLSLEKEGVINVAYISDNSFLLPTFVSIFSLIENRDPKVFYRINVVLDGVCFTQSQVIKSLEVEGVLINLVHVDEDNSLFQIKKKGFHVSTAAIIKFRLPEIFPELDRLLYIDGDTIIQSNLVDVFSTDLDNEYAAVVEDIKPRLMYQPSILEKLNIESHEKYFNSGMLFLNLDEMRKNSITKKLIKYRKEGINFFMDQDALNVVLNNRVKYLSCKNNFLVTLGENFELKDLKHNYSGIEDIESYDSLVNESSIVHFASKNKPWLKYGVKYADLWNEYYIKSGAASKKFLHTHPVMRVFSGKFIVSLTSWPARIDTVSMTVNSLLNQSVMPTKVVLWLAKEQFNNKENDLPQNLLNLISDVFEIKWCEDIRSYKKLVPTLSIFGDEIIITADDDIIYDENWAYGLLKSYMAAPDCIHCYRAHRMSFSEDGTPEPYTKWKRDTLNKESSYYNFFTGCGGVLYPPKSLYHHVVRINDFMNICPTGDDIWFWGMAVLNGTKVKVASEEKFKLNFTPSSQENSLWHHNDGGGANDKMLINLLERYPEITKELKLARLSD